MGLFTKRKRRPSRRAEAKALKHKAALEAKLGAKNERKRQRAEARSQRKVAKAQIAALQAEEKAALETAARAARDPFAPGQISKYIGVARVLVPVLAPLAYRGATYLRGQLDNRRAQQLGVGVDRLGDYAGHGGKLQARIANAEAALDKIANGNSGREKDMQQFVDSAHSRLDALAAAVRTADQLPAGRRRSVHASIGTELSRIEADVLARLGVA